MNVSLSCIGDSASVRTHIHPDPTIGRYAIIELDPNLTIYVPGKSSPAARWLRALAVAMLVAADELEQPVPKPEEVETEPPGSPLRLALAEQTEES